jgi:hypothetical protein
MARLKVFKNRYKTATRASTKLKRMARDRSALNEKLTKLKVQAHLTRQQIANNRKLAAKLQAEERRYGLRSRKK